MPAGLISSLAKQFGASPGTVEGYWAECKKAIHPVAEAKKGGRPSYGVVVNCVKAKLRKRGTANAEKAVAKKLGGR